MTNNKFNFTDFALTKVCKELINDRVFDKSLVTIEGKPSIVNNIASNLSPLNYFYHNPLNITSNEITINFKGAFVPSSNKQCAWALTGTSDSLSLYVSNSSIQVYFGEKVICKLSNLPLKDNLILNIKTRITETNCELYVYHNNETFNIITDLDSIISLISYDSLQIGAFGSSFWNGNIHLNSFSIYDKGILLYTPSTGTFFKLDKIMIGDGTYPLTDTSEASIYHTYDILIEEISRSENTLLIIGKVESDAYLNIKQIGLYDTSGKTPVLFGLADNLTINKSKGLSYDLIFTIDLSLSVVNVVGVPSFVMKEVVYPTYDKYLTTESILLYILTNLERIINKNATVIGYNQAQIYYRLQQDLAEKENCYNAVHTFSKLQDKFVYKSKKEFDPSTVTIMGSPIIEDGNASGFNNYSYLWNDELEMINEDWEIIASFQTNEIGNNEGIITCFTSPCVNQPLKIYLDDGYCKATISQLDRLKVTVGSTSNVIYKRHPFGDTPGMIPPLTFQNPDGTGGTDWNFSAWDKGSSTPFACWENTEYANHYITRLTDIGELTTEPVVEIQNSSEVLNWTFLPELDTSRSWSISIPVSFSSLIEGKQYILDTASSDKCLELYVENSKLKFIAYLIDDPSTPLFTTLVSNFDLSTETQYTIDIGFTGYKYFLEYSTEDTASIEHLEAETSLKMNWGENMLIGGNYIPSDDPINVLLGNIDLSSLSIYSNYSIIWTAASSLKYVYTHMYNPSSTALIYDTLGISIDQISIQELLSGTSFDGNLFEILPNHKYFVKIKSTYNEETEKYILNLYKSNDGVNYEEVTPSPIQTDLPINEVLAVYLGVLPTYDNITINGFTNPLTCKLCLLDWFIKMDTLEWIMYKELVYDNVLLQYYNIPKLRYNSYTLYDLKNKEHELEVLNNGFKGNKDLINFNNGLSLSMKVFLEDTQNKVILAKKTFYDDVYFSLSLENHYLLFNIYAGSSLVKLSKKLELEEYSKYTENPILLTVTFNGDPIFPEFKMYKNNELIATSKNIYAKVSDLEDFVLTSYLNEDNEDKNIFISDLILIENEISQNDLYFINNLMDTNY